MKKIDQIEKNKIKENERKIRIIEDKAEIIK